MRRTRYIAVAVIGAIALALLWPRAGDAAQERLKVRFAEGTTHGFLKLSTPDGKVLASGDQLQTARRGGIETRTVFHFADSSVSEEFVAFTQQDVFEMQSYRVMQRGPAFPYDLDARLSRSGEYVVISKSRKDGKETRDSGRIEMPPDVYNGLMILTAKNLAENQTATVHMVAFMPKPRMVQVTFSLAGTERTDKGTRGQTVRNYRLKPKIGGVTGFFAKVLGKMPPDAHVWIVGGDVPAFTRFQGPLFGGGVVRIDLIAPELR